jgi:hypothetical protein
MVVNVEGFGSVGGYDSDPEWTIIVIYIGEDKYTPKTLVGRVDSIMLVPKKRVSLRGVVFPAAFEKSGIRNERGIEFSVYRDSFGLSYSVYDHDSPDGQNEAGDLSQISYSAPRETSQRGFDISELFAVL